MAEIPVVADADEATVGQSIRTLRETHGVVIVDTAGFRNRTQIMACIAADVVLIPLKPAPDDVDEAVAMLNLVRELNETPERAGRPIEAALVMTMVKPGTVIARAVQRDFRKAGVPLLDIEIKDRFGNPVVPREWFLVPFNVVDEAVERIKDGTIKSYFYDPQQARLVERKAG